MKKIKMTKGGVTGLSGPLNEGEVYEVEDEKADALVASGDAVMAGAGPSTLDDSPEAGKEAAHPGAPRARKAKNKKRKKK